jgi:hypothetical protein
MTKIRLNLLRTNHNRIQRRLTIIVNLYHIVLCVERTGHAVFVLRNFVELYFYNFQKINNIPL